PHVHAGALVWVGFMIFGMLYWLMPRLFQTELWSRRLAEVHFWIGTIGILLYIVAIYAAGLTQGLMWRAFDETGRLAYPDFIERGGAMRHALGRVAARPPAIPALALGGPPRRLPCR